MARAWRMAMGNVTGWLLALAVWAVVIGVYLWARYFEGGRSRVWLDPSMAEVIDVKADLGPITGGMNEPGDAAEDYHQAVMECLGSDYYKTFLPIPQLLRLRSEQFPIRSPEYVLAGAKKRQMSYTARYCGPADWTSRRFGQYKAFEAIAKYCLVKEEILARQGQTQDAEALLKALMVMGRQIEQERLRLQGMFTGLGIQSQAGARLLQLYKQGRQDQKTAAVQTYLKALQDVQRRVDAKAGKTVSQLEGDSPSTAVLMWVVENDKDRMWRIEAALTLGLTKWTAPRLADQDASRQKLQELQQAADPLLRDAAMAALAISREDVRPVR